ncbi:glutamine--tRNA ligase [Psychrobium sp. 1_MG-2023]|uniref:glutamine--tRNA ligase n=1 Tax=Psychrobium sp. 1_MG-2023 TaxID=3062624 RepID=UPI000C3264A8|nr:glutamine--tRNA ligase [Psychrobium sp. 1_MG-2023]MDP2562188.1 glutamine--tRNA ligase [Psychrobium sp. 1_MG-2023]PKF58108.1 glutamine--tRNA ligase [Alteromonadales bacterium alter-6D02]
MSQDAVRVTNFIRNIIDADLASGKHTNIVTRFPPEPNGYLHIGHAKSICLNFGIGQDYKGQTNLRFDDTNPEKEDIDFVNSIKEDVKWLGFEWAGDIRYSSNYFEQLYQYAIELINNGKAFVCELDAEQMREYRGTLKQPGKPSPSRDRSIEENLDLFERMRNGEFAEGQYSLRAKIDMASPNIKMRDPILYRIRFVEHHQTGDKWCIYPMYDFTHCISDAIEGITHSLCTLEFEDHRPLYDWVIDNISIETHPQQIEFSRLNLEYTVMSKRKLASLVENNLVDGWNDPRMPTIAGMRRRGYTPQSIVEFCKRIGVTKQENVIEMSALESCLREDLDSKAPRAMVVLDPIKLVIENYPEDQVEQLTASNHPKDESMGTRTIPFSREVYIDRADFREEANKKYKRLVLDKEVRLRNGYVVKALRCDKDDNGDVTTVYGTYDPETLGKKPSDGRSVKGVIHWVSASEGVNAEVRIYDRLFTEANPAAAEDFAEVINPESLIIRKNAIAEPSLVSAPAELAYQFEREGYFCADNQDSSPEHLVFNRTVGLRDTWAKQGA